MRRVPLSAALTCLQLMLTTLVLNSFTPSVAAGGYPPAWPKLGSSKCSDVQGAYLDSGTADDGTAWSLTKLFMLNGITVHIGESSPDIVKLSVAKGGVLEGELWADGQRYKLDLIQKKGAWKCTGKGIRFKRTISSGWDDYGKVTERVHLYFRPSTDGSLVIRILDTGTGHYIFIPFPYPHTNIRWYRFPSADREAVEEHQKHLGSSQPTIAEKLHFQAAPPPPAGYALVYIYRLGAPPLVKTKVHVDGGDDILLKLPKWGYSWFYLEPGSHQVRTRKFEPTRNIDVESGKTYYLKYSAAFTRAKVDLVPEDVALRDLEMITRYAPSEPQRVP